MTFHFCLRRLFRAINLNYQKAYLVGVQCFNRNVMFCLKSTDLNDFSLKLMKYSYTHRKVDTSGTPSGTS